MANKDLFKQAIAEAKSIREAAIANAKDALEETLTPHLKDMLAAKLQEMESEEIAEESVNEAPAKEKKDEGKHKKDEKKMEEEKVNEEEVVAEDDTIEEESIEEATEDVNEAPAKEKKDEEVSEEVNEDEAIEEETVEEAEVTAEAEDDSEESEDDAEEDEEMEVKDMDVEDLKGLIRDLIAQEMGGGHGEEEGLEDEAPAEEEEINLEALLEELENTTAEGKHKKEESVEEEVTEDTDVTEDENPVAEDETINEISPEAVEMLTGLAGAVGVIGGSAGLATLMQNAKDGKYGEKVKKLAFGLEKAGGAAGGAIRHNMGQREEVELNEALDTIETLRTELSEVNLLNAKLLYVNKVFKSNDLSESQKVNVIAAFDKAETVKEVKLVYETVADNVVAKKANIKEHKNLGQASKATGTTASKPEVITEVNETVLRMQKLAGIIK